MTSYIASAREALSLFRKGSPIAEIKAKTNDRYAVDVRRKINVAAMEEEQSEPKLSSDELILILSVGRAERRALECGDTCSPKLKYCGGAFWARGKAERVARRRLGSHRRGETPEGKGTGLNLLAPYHGGYVRLTRSGWALFHALEEARPLS